MHTLPTVLSSLAVLIAALAWLYAVKCWSFCRDTEEFIKKQNVRSVSLKKLSEIEVEMTDLTDSVQALVDGHKKLRSRIGMRHQRAQKSNGESALPDRNTDPIAYKAALRLQLQQSGRLK